MLFILVLKVHKDYGAPTNTTKHKVLIHVIVENKFASDTFD